MTKRLLTENPRLLRDYGPSYAKEGTGRAALENIRERIERGGRSEPNADASAVAGILWSLWA